MPAIRQPTPRASSSVALATMRANKSRNTSLELRLRALLRESGLTGYRLHPDSLPGTPDLVFRQARIAVFVHGCFWHRCAECDLPLPKANRRFWIAKFRRTRWRDRNARRQLRAAGWHTVQVWEHDVAGGVRAVVRAINAQRGAA